MSNKVTVLGLIVATAFIFTSCTKDTDVVPANRFAAPTATIDAPTLKNEYAEADNGWSLPSTETAPVAEPGTTPPTAGNVNRNEYSEADNGWSMPSTETAPVNGPGTTPPTVNNTNKSADFYLGIKQGFNSNPAAPVQVQANADRNSDSYYMGIKQGFNNNPSAPLQAQANADRNSDLYYLGERGGFNGPATILPANEQPSSARDGMFKDPYPIMPIVSEPHVIPHPSTNPVGEATNYGKLGLEVNTPDCGFPVVGTEYNSNTNY